jgi:glutathione S-transferase
VRRSPSNAARRREIVDWFTSRFRAAAEKDPERAREQFLDISDQLGVLNDELADKDYLLGDRFSVADLNVSAVLSWSQAGRFDLSAWPNVSEWLGRCLNREAAVAARG